MEPAVPLRSFLGGGQHMFLGLGGHTTGAGCIHSPFPRVSKCLEIGWAGPEKPHGCFLNIRGCCLAGDVSNPGVFPYVPLMYVETWTGW